MEHDNVSFSESNTFAFSMLMLPSPPSVSFVLALSFVFTAAFSSFSALANFSLNVFTSSLIFSTALFASSIFFFLTIGNCFFNDDLFTLFADDRATEFLEALRRFLDCTLETPDDVP